MTSSPSNRDTNGDGNASSPAAGDWSGISLATGSGATSAPSGRPAYTTVAYDQSFTVSNASSVSLTNSSFVRGAGLANEASTWGINVDASGPITVTNDVVNAGGGGGSAYGIQVSQEQPTGSTTVSGNSVQNADSMAISVYSTQASITVQNNTVSGGTGRAFQLYSAMLTPSKLTGNTPTGDRQNVLAVSGTLATSWSLPYAGLAGRDRLRRAS